MLSKLIRRTHMYLALFLLPWVAMYTASTFVMNHRAWFRGQPPPPQKWETVRELSYSGEFAPEVKPRDMAVQILASLDLDGAHQVQERDGKLVIRRQSMLGPQSLTYNPQDRKVVIERLVTDGPMLLEQWHRRRGFQQPYLVDDIWAFLVDLFIVVTLFWVASGLWMWWEMKVTRRWGAVCLAGGAGLFALFLAVL